MNDKNLEKGEATRFKSGVEAVKAGRKGGIASGEAKRGKKRLTDVLRSILNEDSDNIEYCTKLEEIVGKTLKNLTKKPNIYELKTLQEMLGEYVQKVETTDTTPPEEKLKKMMKDAGLC